jgi:hypothetical protein
MLIRFDSTTPPEGTINRGQGEVPVEFAGWLGLLAALQELAWKDDPGPRP